MLSKRFSRYLADCHEITLDCSAQILGKASSNRRWLTKEEIEKLYSACANTPNGIMNRALLSVYYGLGLRRSEGVALNIEDIYCNLSAVYVKKGKLCKERYVPITSSVFKDIDRYILHVRKQRLQSDEKKKERALFVTENGHRITGNAIYERLQNLAISSNVRTPVSLHCLRHSIATHLLSAGMKLENISSFLGHSSLESTQIYTHLAQKSF